MQEIKDFEREQRLLGGRRKIAWNYQQFSVKYDSLENELRVGAIYIRYFLDSDGDHTSQTNQSSHCSINTTDGFLRSLENPNQVVLFEKLFRRMLVQFHIDNPNSKTVAIQCTRCASRLYAVCKDIIGGFDDMLMIVHLLDQASNLELQQVPFPFPFPFPFPSFFFLHPPLLSTPTLTSSLQDVR